MKWLVTRMVTPASASVPIRDQNSRQRIDTRSGFVEEQDAGRVQQRGRKREALLHAEWQFACDAGCGSSEVEAGQGRVNRTRLCCTAEAIHAREEAEILQYGEFGVQ
jgi:hypothetical protein